MRSAQSLIAIALFTAAIAYIKLYEFKAANFAMVQQVQQCSDAAVELDVAPSLHNLIDSGKKAIDQRTEAEQVTRDQHATTIYSDCLAWARSGFGAIGK